MQKYTPPPPPPNWDDDDEASTSSSESSFVESHGVEPMPVPPSVLPEEDEPLPPPFEVAFPPPLPVEEAEEEPLPPAPPAEEAEEEPLPPAPPVEEDVDTFIPPPPPPPAPQKKGNGPIIAMSVVTVFALMLGFQWQGNINRVNADVQKQQSELTEQQEQTKIHTDVLNKAEQLKKEIEEKTAKNEAICAEGRKAEEERDALRQILRSGRSVSHEMERLQADCEKMENLINNLDSRIAYYLPPEQLSAEKLRERDEYLRRLACTYLRARTIGCTILIKKMCANRLRHHLNAMQMTYADRVAGAMDSEFKGYSGKRMFSPISLAYSGVRVEVLSEVTSPGKPKQWCKECWTFNEEGEIIRWEEHLTSGAQPALSEKFRHINLIGQNKK